MIEQEEMILRLKNKDAEEMFERDFSVWGLPTFGTNYQTALSMQIHCVYSKQKLIIYLVTLST